jgi:C_GCAxxG_C_C family probable redox protein
MRKGGMARRRDDRLKDQAMRNQELNRRTFVGGATAATAALVLSACDAGKTPPTDSGPGKEGSAPPPAPKSQATGLSREAVLALADGKVEYYMRLCHNCAQTSYLALHETFGVGDRSLTKALTPLPGIAERGETCGAVIGSLLAIGFVYGRERLDDWAGWRGCLVPARAFCERFETELGSTRCGDIVEKVFGQRYNLADPVDLGKFQEAGATAKCTQVVRTGVRLAAGIILDKTHAGD